MMRSGGRVTSPVRSPLRIVRAGEQDWAMEQITIGDGVYYANYKEPFEQLEGAMPGYPVGELPYDVDGKLLCPYSDRHPPERRTERADRHGRTRIRQYVHPKTYQNLGAHLAKTHGMKADEFKSEAGLNQGTALVSERTRLLNSAQAQRQRRHRASMFGEGREFTPEESRRGATKGGHGRRTPQALNRRNVCYSQVLVTAQQVLAANGRITEPLMRKEGVSYRIIATHFGSWQKFMQRFGQKTKGTGYRLRGDDLIRDLQSVAAYLGHTPTLSDMRRHEMASRASYERHFGSWVAACERAGVQPNVPSAWLSRPYTTDEDGAILGAYAMTGSYTKAAELHGISAQRGRAILLRYGLVPLNGNTAMHVERQEQMARAAELTRSLIGVA